MTPNPKRSSAIFSVLHLSPRPYLVDLDDSFRSSFCAQTTLHYRERGCADVLHILFKRDFAGGYVSANFPGVKRNPADLDRVALVG